MKRALISVFYKEGIDNVARQLSDQGWEIISTGGTASFLTKEGIKVTEVSEITGFPEILNGRVKTLNPHIFGPILAKNSPAHLEQLKEIKSRKIDLVIVNFYPFEEALQNHADNIDRMIENIDIGGPSMVRAAAKNFKDTVVVVDSADYASVTEELLKEWPSPERRLELARKAFTYTSFYDSLIGNYFNTLTDEVSPFYNPGGRLEKSLRYGENPHQKAALYINDKNSPLADMVQYQGKELSCNNILDLSMVYEVLNDFQDDNFTVIVKHQNPCGAAIGDTQQEAYEKALEGDPRSAFGGITGFTKTVTKETATLMKKMFFEVIIAPDFEEEALEIFRKKKNLRVIKMKPGYREQSDIKTVPGGLLVQDRDNLVVDSDDFELKTGNSLSASAKKDVAFGWKMVKFVKSNAIILVKDGQLIGVGAGQMSRVDSVEISINKSIKPLEGSVLVSDAFFPFADSIETAAANGIGIVVEPGGSVRDEEVIAKAEEKNISLLFTGVRHFRH